MKISLYSIGKTKDSDPTQLLIDEYIKRTRWIISAKELSAKLVCKDEEQQKSQESDLLLSQCQDACHIVSLDAAGKMLSSEEFAALLQKFQLSGFSEVAFLIGGAYGHHKKLLQRSGSILSLGKMILPHRLARLVLVEQIYRAWCITNDHPYHK